MNAESIYIRTFGLVSERADYLEPEDGPDFLLAEAFIASVVTTIIFSFLGGAFQELGKKAAEKFVQRAFRDGTLTEAPPEVAVKTLEQYSEQFDQSAIERGTVAVQKKLMELGLPSEIAVQLSQELKNEFDRSVPKP